ncbi:MAG: ABC transporter permease [Acetatifactor sp.]|nr:ABC transporter permease [Acetatifactor sp.]
MKDIIVIIKKELARFFGDKRMVFTTLLMPGLMIYIMYTFMGEGLANKMTTPEDYVSKVYVQNMPEEMAPMLNQLPVEWTVATDADHDKIMAELKEGETDAMMVFPVNFVADMAAYDVTGGTPAPNVEIYYNSSETNSASFYQMMKQVLGQYEETLANKWDINAGDKDYDCSSESEFMANLLAMMLPMLIMTFVFSGCISTAPESIAGEKERGTIATLLVTPVKRSSLALGKIISLSVIALLAGISSFIGTIISLPKMMAMDMEGITISYGVQDYAALLLVIFSTVLVMVSIIALMSAIAKSVKEAGTMTSPLMLINVGVSLIPMFTGVKDVATTHFLIPIYNSVMMMNGVFSSNYSLTNLAVTVVTNLVLTALLSVGLTAMFNSEKVMFAK